MNPSELREDSAEVIVQQKIILQAFECAFNERSVTYLSGPITTGPRFIEWYFKTGKSLGSSSDPYLSSLRENVIQPNEVALKSAAANFRAKLLAVIEPGSLQVTGWKQTDYHLLWVRVIERFIARLIMLDGWQFSTGCVIEFYEAIKRGIPVERPDSSPISAADGAALVQSAVTTIRAQGIPLDTIEAFALRICEIAKSGRRDDAKTNRSL